MSSSEPTTARPSCSASTIKNNSDPPKEHRLSKSLLEKILGKKVASFQVTPGSHEGYFFLSYVYAVQVALDDDGKKAKDSSTNGKVLYLMVKTHPSKAGLQHVVNEMNVFWREVNVYGDYIPFITGLQERLGFQNKEIIRPPHPEFIGGSALDYVKLVEDCQYWEDAASLKVEMRRNNYLVMVDHKKTDGFEMVDKRIPLDYDHMVLAIKELAKMHALGWAYKETDELPTLTSKHPYLNDNLFTHEAVRVTLNVNFGFVLDILHSHFPADSRVMQAMERIKEITPVKIVNAFLPAYGIIDEKKVCRFMAGWMEDQPEFFPDPWTVSCHGDCWSTNMLFKYGENVSDILPTEDQDLNSLKPPPKEMMFVDLQHYREGCPTTDLAVLLYTCTTKDFRKEHLNTLLKIYHDTFLEICDHFDVDPLPKFTMENLLWRYKRVKIFGFLMACFYIPTMLSSKEDIDVEPMGHVEAFRNTPSYRKIAERIVDVANELLDDQIF